MDDEFERRRFHMGLTVAVSLTLLLAVVIYIIWSVRQ